MERKCFGDLNLVIFNIPIKCGHRQNCNYSMISVLFKNMVQKNNEKKWTKNVNIACPKVLALWIIFIFFLKMSTHFFYNWKRLILKCRHWWSQMSCMEGWENASTKHFFPLLFYFWNCNVKIPWSWLGQKIGGSFCTRCPISGSV